MVHHYPKTFWSLLSLSYAMIIGACYSWVESHEWPYAASTLGTILLVTFALISISYVGRETAINTRALVGLLDREGRGIKREDTAGVDVRASILPPITVPSGDPIAPVVIKTTEDGADPAERNRLIAQNTGELQKVAEEAHGLRQEIKRAREG